ncbi:MAG TPA: plastocyanin/azurin family copper-binding protein [Gaiellaceae bacterium]|nr:plastocyanin/azurin family copper-binding protein [Gaiellaceae bacterium]
MAVAVALAIAGAAIAALRGHSAGTAGVTIRVTEREYHIALAKNTVKAGTVTFVVHNAGKQRHALAVSGGGLSAAKKTAMIAPGATRSLTVKLSTGGKLALWCPVPGHAALGMRASLKVSGGAPSTGGGATAGTTTAPAGGGGEAWG